MIFVYLLIYLCFLHICVLSENDLKNFEKSNETEADYEVGAENIEKEKEVDYDELDTKWIKEAVLNVGYFLRSYKFNDFDRRFQMEKPTNEDYLHIFGAYPKPPLRAYHWDVFNKCSQNLTSCLRYLYETAVDSNLQKSIDSAVIIKKSNWSLSRNREQIQTVDEDCKRLRKLDEENFQPFRNFLEQFQWKTTASYYMCWYTMQEMPELKHFGEPCDDFAYCTWDDYKYSTEDPRADDKIPFSCAMYSFCPDPCCPIRSITNMEDCKNLKFNPCNEFLNQTCSFNRSENQDLISSIYNEWNISCVCNQSIGYQWNSRYGMCVDIDECENVESCKNATSEICFNLPGSFKCGCSYGYIWSEANKSCQQSKAVMYAMKRFSDFETPEEEEEEEGNSGLKLAPSKGTLFFYPIIITVYSFL